MAIFNIKGSHVTRVPSLKVGIEKDIQKLFEDNLQEILNIHFLATEYSTSSGGRIDSLGIDNNGAPVIVEYKKGQNNNVINQGLSYLKWLLDHRAEFNELLRKKKLQIEVDWASPRVICVAERYNKFDLDTVDLLPISIELLKYKLYENGILVVEPEVASRTRVSTVKIFAKDGNASFRTSGVVHSLADHMRVASESTKTLFEELKEKIKALDDSVIEEVKATYIAYKLTTNFVDVVIQRNALKLFLNISSGKLDDPNKLARDLTKPKKVGHWGNGDYELKVNSDSDLDEVFKLIEQSYDFNK